jgi:hypothetical protein
VTNPYVVSMARAYFSPVLFIDETESTNVDTKAFPYFYNDNGKSTHVKDPKGTLIEVVEDPSLNMGQRYDIVSCEPKIINPGQYQYTITEFDFGVEKVHYEPLWATKETARAFGVTLVHSGESVKVGYDGKLTSTPYTYGAFAAYESPYIGSDRSRELLTVNATDLEFHAFPHIFCSQDEIPLVTTVARWRPAKKEIHLADLWVRPGDCLYIPAKKFSEEYVDMHGNGNSAHACWAVRDRGSIATNTTLDPGPMPTYHEEKHDTVHGFPPGYPK